MGGVMDAIGSIFGGNVPDPIAVESPEAVLAKRDAAAASEMKKQKIAAVQAIGRDKLNNVGTGSLGVVDDAASKGGLF